MKKKLTHIKLFEDLNPENNTQILDNDYRIVYRAGNVNHNGLFFSEEEYYAKLFAFGGPVFKYKIFTGKVLNLKKYNKEIEKLNVKDDLVFDHISDGGFFQMHKISIDDKYAIEVNLLSILDHKELSNEFTKELDECDSIYGSDTGFTDSDNWYIKDKKNVEII